MILGGLVLELHMIVLVAFKERTFSLLLDQRAPSQKQSCVHFNPPPPQAAKTHAAWRSKGIRGPRSPGLSWSTTSQHFLFQTLCWMLKMQRKRGVFQELSHG